VLKLGGLLEKVAISEAEARRQLGIRHHRKLTSKEKRSMLLSHRYMPVAGGAGGAVGGYLATTKLMGRFRIGHPVARITQPVAGAIGGVLGGLWVNASRKNAIKKLTGKDL